MIKCSLIINEGLKIRQLKTKALSPFKVFTRQGYLGLGRYLKIPCRPILENNEERTPPPCLPNSGILMAWRAEDLSVRGRPSLPFS